MVKCIISIIVLAFGLSSCHVSDKVVSNNIIQKRKYNKGFFLNKGSIVSVSKRKKKIVSMLSNKKRSWLVSDSSSTISIQSLEPDTNNITDGLNQRNNNATGRKRKTVQKQIKGDRHFARSSIKKAQSTNRRQPKKFPADSNSDENPKFEKHVRASMFITLGLILLGIMGAPITSILLPFLFLFPLAFILNIIGMVKIARNPSKYKGMVIALFLLVTSILFLAAIGLIFISLGAVVVI